ncbi:MAG: HAMP domain-containing protein, partial [Deltaproteobacteria bacterium]|nr:HAMP domain-containing protein [Deltaproteobacteria bacterium]
MSNIFANLKVSWKLAAVFLTLLMMMGVGGSVGLYNAMQIARLTEGLYKDFSRRLDTISTIEKKTLDAEEKDAVHRSYQRAVYLSKGITGVTLTFTILAIIFSITLWSILTRSIVRPIELLETAASRMAEGNLKERIAI